MIARLRGTVLTIRPPAIVIDVNGVGYRMACSQAMLDKCEIGRHADVHTHMLVREDDISLYGFASEDEVLARANACDMGLSAYAFTTNPARARRTVAALKAGMVGINSFAMAASEAPFGGTNHSGMGREGGTEGIRDYLDVKSSQMVWA